MKRLTKSSLRNKIIPKTKMDMMKSLKEKTIVITGATSGIGLAVAEALVKEGMFVIGVGRAPDRCAQTEQRLRTLHPHGGPVTVLTADLSIQAVVRSLAIEISQTLAKWDRNALDVLVNNAGIVPFWQTLTPEGFDLQWAVNHLAPFLLTHELLPLLSPPRPYVSSRSVLAPTTTRVSIGRTFNYADTTIPCELIIRPSLRTYYSPLSLSPLGTWFHGACFRGDLGLVNTEIGLKSNSFMARWLWDIRRRGGITPEEWPRVSFIWQRSHPSKMQQSRTGNMAIPRHPAPMHKTRRLPDSYGTSLRKCAGLKTSEVTQCQRKIQPSN